MTISSWSHSKLNDFEKCKFLCWLKHDQKIPEPERPLPPGRLEHANDRGTRIHTACELYINGTLNEPAPEAEKNFGFQIDLLRAMYKDGLVSLEGEWAMNEAWEPCNWNGEWLEADAALQHTGTARKLPERGREGDIVKVGKKVYMWVPAWLRLKLDAMVMHDEYTATVIDFKTGRKFGNEVKHAEQLQLYQLVTFLRYPKLETVFAELWYLDQKKGENLTSQKFTRSQGLRFKPRFHQRGTALTTCTEWPANPSRFTCQWCQYGPWNGGQCQVGVR